MRISIFGLGYVGVVSCGCLASRGHEIIGVDVSQAKVELLNSGRSPVVEAGIDELVRDAVATGRLRATTNAEEAILGSSLSIVAVGTPSLPNGNIDLRYVDHVSEQIGRALATTNVYHTVVVRSTMLPGSMRARVIPALERWSGKIAGRDFGVCYNPEFLREGSSVQDFLNPSKTVVGADGPDAASVLNELYAGVTGPKIFTAIEVSEMVKYADNNFHAVKVTFANEIGMLCRTMGLDAHDVMDIFVQDTRLNLSPYYLRPGFAFGGACLPKDVAALTYKAKESDLQLPLLQSLLASNKNQVNSVLELVTSFGKRRIGVLGFSFKAGTDDLRGSPVVDLIESLLGKGFDLRLFDQNVHVSRLVGQNQSYIEQRIPHLARLMVPTIEEVIDSSEVVIIGNNAPEFASAVGSMPSKTIIVDLVRVDRTRRSGGSYYGIAW
jgi:GDP-mannose 6-dehydrogenase